MFKKSLGQRIPISRHKQIVIAAIAISAMLLYAIPAQQFVSATTVVPIPPPEEEETIVQDQVLAQRLVDQTRQRITQDAVQEQEQEQEQEIEQDIEQSNEANIDQSEENNQAAVIETGDNTATTTQIGDNDAIGNEMAAESEGGSAEAYRSDKASVSGGDSGDASASIEQEVGNTATTTQDSSADDNLLVNQNEFGDDIAIVDQDNEAEQDAANIGLQEQEQDLTQEAANVDINVNVAEQVIQTPTPTQPPDDGEDGVFCFAFEGDVGFAQAFCFETRAECEEGRVVTENRPPFTPTQECREFATIPPGGGNCRVVGDEVQCDPV